MPKIDEAPPSPTPEWDEWSGNPSRRFVGIDPGGSGGIAIILDQGNGSLSYSACAMPKTEKGIWATLSEIYSHAFCKSFTLIEEVGGYLPPRKGIGGDGEKKYGGDTGSSMFKFGQSYGGLRMALIAAGLDEGRHWKSLRPFTWQKGLKIDPRARGEKKPAFKNRLKRFAQELFPGKATTLKTADALLIAEYCRRDHAFLFPGI